MNKVETGLYIPLNRKERIYIIEDSSGNYLADVSRIIKIKDNSTPLYNQVFMSFEYELNLNTCKNLSNNEIQMIRIYYHNLIRTLTNDMQTLYTDNIEERMQLPFYQNILHVKIVS